MESVVICYIGMQCHSQVYSPTYGINLERRMFDNVMTSISLISRDSYSAYIAFYRCFYKYISYSVGSFLSLLQYFIIKYVSNKPADLTTCLTSFLYKMCGNFISCWHITGVLVFPKLGYASDSKSVGVIRIYGFTTWNVLSSLSLRNQVSHTHTHNNGEV
jgi:hypothetical protein